MPKMSKQEKALDKEIARLYGLHSQGTAISVMDILKLYADVRHAVKLGLATTEQAVITAIAKYNVEI